jgi:hypothetical protein
MAVTDRQTDGQTDRRKSETKSGFFQKRAKNQNVLSINRGTVFQKLTFGLQHRVEN